MTANNEPIRLTQKRAQAGLELMNRGREAVLYILRDSYGVIPGADGTITFDEGTEVLTPDENSLVPAAELLTEAEMKRVKDLVELLDRGAAAREIIEHRYVMRR